MGEGVAQPGSSLAVGSEADMNEEVWLFRLPGRQTLFAARTVWTGKATLRRFYEFPGEALLNKT
jgi:hypothetical protein